MIPSNWAWTSDFECHACDRILPPAEGICDGPHTAKQLQRRKARPWYAERYIKKVRE